MLYWDIFTARGWVAIFVIFHYWGSFVTSSNDCILTPLLCLLLPFGMRDAEHRSPKNLWNSSRWFASGASLTISVVSAQVRPSQFPIDDGPLLATGLPPIFSFHVLMSIPTIDWNLLFNTIAYIEFRPTEATTSDLLGLYEDLSVVCMLLFHFGPKTVTAYE